MNVLDLADAPATLARHERGLAAPVRWAVAGDHDARLLAGPVASAGRECYEDHLARLGVLRLEAADPERLRAEVRESGLLGRGGGAFPSATKFDVAAASPGDPLIVVNASEGEPASRKDQTLLALRPHLVLDGAEVAATAVGATEIVIYTHGSPSGARTALDRALGERAPSPRRWRVAEAPESYIAGETSAVVSFLDGRGAIPRRGPVPAARVGVARRPTVVNNVETLAHLALIARRGASWFREAGASEAPGSTLLTLTGAVSEPGRVIEVLAPVTIGELLAAFAGRSVPPRAVLLGGYEGTWMDGTVAWATPLERHRLARVGVSLGCGVVAVLGEDSCGLAETARVVAWLAGESAGQCGPCIFGLPALSELLDDVVAGQARGSDVRKLRELVASVRGRGACGHPTGVATLVESALDTFADELEAHRRGAACDSDGRDFVVPTRGRAR